MSDKQTKSAHSWWESFVYFFPVQLLFVHLKKNLILLIYWVILFGIVTKAMLLKYGVPYLFLYPEYLGEVNAVSHFIVGICLGAFIMAFNLSSYVVNGFRFPFLATLNRPFIKYCQNNIVLPLSFSIIYMVLLYGFQLEYEQLTRGSVVINLVGFLAGNLVFIAITAVYFIATNRNTSHYQSEKKHDKQVMNPVSDLFSNKQQWSTLEGKSSKEWKVVTYISKWGMLALARDSSHYRRSTLEKVFAQNRINASLFQVGIITVLFILGWFSNTSWLMIPAAASILLFFTILIMLTSALYSWFKGWTTPVIFGMLLVLNFASENNMFQYRSQAYGMVYGRNHALYNQESIRQHQRNEEIYKLDVKEGLKYLENWKARQKSNMPVAVFINVPGGGLRSAMWTAQSLNFAQEQSNGQLWPVTLLISGSSGGMIGAAYLREYYFRLEQQLTSLPFDTVIADLAKDKLNAVAATAVMNDLLFRFKRFEYLGQTYTIDRARAFEQKLNNDTRGWLNKPLIAYRKPEFSARMPMLLLAPTVSNDGRKLIISSQDIGYLAHSTTDHQINENIEFRRFFDDQKADSINFLSAIRMSATFPYVFPAASLPSVPPVEILDAGIRDNYGISNTLKFIYTFRHWLHENTSRVIILQVRDQQKFIDKKPNESRSLVESLTQPLGTFYNTVLDIQDYQMEDQLRLAFEWYEGEIEVLELVLERSDINPISLSWHLTEKEKQRIYQSIESDYNRQTSAHLRDILTSPKP